MIEIKNLTVTYGSTVAIDNISTTFENGKIYGLLGPNGAGKTSLLKILLTLCKPYYGKVIVDGLDIVEHKETIKRQIGFVTDEFLLFEKLNAYEYLEFLAALYGVHKDNLFDRRVDYLFELLGLKSKAGYSIETYSFGMKKKLSFASAIIHNSKIILLDEPLTGVDAESAYVIKSLLKMFASEGKVILLATHIFEIAQSLCDEAVILDKGEIVTSGSIEDILSASKGKNLEEIFLQLTGGAKYKYLTNILLKKEKEIFPLF